MDKLKPITNKEIVILGVVVMICSMSLVTLFVLFGFEILNTAFNKGK